MVLSARISFLFRNACDTSWRVSLLLQIQQVFTT